MNGIIVRIDAPNLNLSLRADDGERLELTTVNVDAMRRLQAGDHVRADLDEHGAVLNIDKTVQALRPISYSLG